jgi:hypothetical protein
VAAVPGDVSPTPPIIKKKNKKNSVCVGAMARGGSNDPRLPSLRGILLPTGTLNGTVNIKNFVNTPMLISVINTRGNKKQTKMK